MSSSCALKRRRVAVGQFGGVDLQGAVAAGAQFVDAGGIDVEADGVVLLAELDRERQADVAQSDDPYPCLGQCLHAPMLLCAFHLL